MTGLVIAGVAGKMGSAILRLALADEGIGVAGGLEVPGHPWVGKGFEPAPGAAAVSVTDDLSRVAGEWDVIIDFTDPAASLAHFRTAKALGKGIVIGTTGFGDDALKEIRSAKDARVVISPNMSVGMNLMFDTVERLAAVLTEGYDAEIVEMHHRLKKDAPSGTAVKLMEVVESSRPDRNWVETFGRKGITGERKAEEIGVLALRGGDVVGEHTVMFAGIGERLEITHRAYSRDNFARGAIMAAKWLAAKGTAGVYSMKDVLGL